MAERVKLRNKVSALESRINKRKEVNYLTK
jgi:hypothetical protein